MKHEEKRVAMGKREEPALSNQSHEMSKVGFQLWLPSVHERGDLSCELMTGSVHFLTQLGCVCRIIWIKIRYIYFQVPLSFPSSFKRFS